MVVCMLLQMLHFVLALLSVIIFIILLDRIHTEACGCILLCIQSESVVGKVKKVSLHVLLTYQITDDHKR